MTDPEWVEWTKHHAALLGMAGEADMALFRLWRPLLAHADLVELKAASLWIAANSSDRWRTQHLRLLLERLRVQAVEAARKRLLAAEAEAQTRDRASRCGECGGRGLLDVPHLSQVRDGEWVPAGQTFYLVVVTCRCALGEARHRALRDVFEARATSEKRWPKPEIISVLDYELHNPNWPRQVEDREWARQARRKAEEETRHVDRVRGPLSWVQGHAKRLAAGASPGGEG